MFGHRGKFDLLIFILALGLIYWYFKKSDPREEEKQNPSVKGRMPKEDLEKFKKRIDSDPELKDQYNKALAILERSLIKERLMIQTDIIISSSSKVEKILRSKEQTEKLTKAAEVTKEKLDKVNPYDTDAKEQMKEIYSELERVKDEIMEYIENPSPTQNQIPEAFLPKH